MKITILNGTPEPASFDHFVDQLSSSLEAKGHAVTRLDLRDIPLRYCIGCWGCWVKTPGECTSQDASVEMDRAIINSDFTLWAAPLKMGFPSALLKMAIDKHIPLIHPYMEVNHGEAHHLKRYEHYPRLGLLVGKEADTDEADIRILTDIFSRTALNFKTKLEFLAASDQSMEEIIRKIVEPKKGSHLYRRALAPVQGVQISSPKRMTVFNGSPRGRRGNTPILLGEFMKGYGGEFDLHHLVRVKEIEAQALAFAEAECIWFGFPLYTDAMPGIVKNFIEALEPLRGRPNNPPIGFLVQSGFPEALHSRYIERYLQKLAARLGSPYLGTIVKGNGEGVRMLPSEASQGLFENLHSLGSDFADRGQLNSETLAKIANPERFPTILSPLFQVFLRLPIAHSYFDNMLKQNGVYEKRFARPFVEGV